MRDRKENGGGGETELREKGGASKGKKKIMESLGGTSVIEMWKARNVVN